MLHFACSMSSFFPYFATQLKQMYHLSLAMERKNTNLFFVSGILLLFALLFLGKSHQKQENTFWHPVNKANDLLKPKPAPSTQYPAAWLQKVNLEEAQSSTQKR